MMIMVVYGPQPMLLLAATAALGVCALTVHAHVFPFQPESRQQTLQSEGEQDEEGNCSAVRLLCPLSRRQAY